MGTDFKSMDPAAAQYYKGLIAKNELTRSDVSMFPSYTRMAFPFFVVCRQRYYKDGVKQRRQFIKEIKIEESLESRALDGVRVHREFCNPVIIPPAASEIIKLTREESMRLEQVLVTKHLSKMFANAFQSGFISVFYSVGSNPLSLWDKSVKNGHIRRVVDDEVKSLVLEISGTNVATTYITCPIKARASLAIKLPFLVMIVKNMKKYFTFEIQIADDKDMRRRFRVSNFQSTTKVRPFCTTMPIGLSPGWNQIQFNLADFTKRAYGTTYLETVRVQIHANVRIRRIYFSDRLYGDDEMPQEFKLFLPVPGTRKRQKDQKKGDAEKKPTVEGEAELPSVAPPATPAESPKLEESDLATPVEEQPASVEEAASSADAHEIEALEAAASVVEGTTPEEGPPTDEEAPAPTEAAPAEGGEEAPADSSAEAPAEALAEASDEAPAEAPAEEPPAE